MADDTDINERIQTLPQELQDRIQDWTFAIDSKVTQISRLYKTPKQLGISRATRQAFARAYYSHTKFMIPRLLKAEDGSEHPHPRMLYALKWLASLPHEHRSMISHIRIERYWGSSGSARRRKVDEAIGWIQDWDRLPVDRDCLFAQLELQGSDGSYQTQWVNWTGAQVLL